MMTPNINKMEIQKLSASKTTYQRGIAYFQNGRVTEIEVDPNHSNIYRAIVIGQESYEVLIFVDKHNHVEDAECSCSAYYSYDGHCKHIVAALLFLCEYYDQSEQVSWTGRNVRHLGTLQSRMSSSRAVSDRNQQAIHNLIRRFQHERLNVSGNSSKDPLSVEYKLGLTTAQDRELDMWLTVQLKVGMERLYVVKNIHDFLKAFKEQRPLIFTKNYTYDPTLHCPTPEDEKMLRFLLVLYQNERLYQQLLHPWGGGQTNERMLIIPPNEIAPFLKLLPDGHYLLEHNGKEYTQLPVIENECPISFSLDEQGDYFVLQSNSGQTDLSKSQDPSQEIALLSEDGYCFDSGKIYKLNRLQRELILPLHYQVQQMPNQKLLITSKQMEDFSSAVLPYLKKESRLTMDPRISRKIVQLPLRAQIDLDFRREDGEEERLIASITYRYGETTVQPLQNGDEQNQSNMILIRDTETEQQIMSIFEEAAFKYNGQELYLDDEDDLYRFLYNDIAQLEKLAEVYMDKSVQQILIEPKNRPVPRVDIDSSTHWLEFHFEMPNVEEGELKNILKAFIEKKSYYRLSSGAFVPLQNEMVEPLRSFLQEEVSKQLIESGHKLKIPVYRAFQLDELSEENIGVGVKKGQSFRRLIRNIKDPENLEFSSPATIAPVLRDYQHFGFQWMKMLSYYRFGGILADDMGLGKTVQALAYMVSELEENDFPHAPALVITPASLIYNWEKECARFAPQLKTIVVAGDREEREILLQDITNTDVIITSYPLLRRDIDWYEPYSFQTLILDEAQSFKNQQSQTFQAVKRIRSGTCFALSGTPIENTLNELWSIFDVVLPGLFPSQKEFHKLSPEQISKRVRPFILRRMKQDVLAELPDKIESVQFSELTSEQKKLYLATLKQIQKETEQSLQTDGFQKSRMKVLAGLTRLRQLCCHPSLYLENYTSDSGKFHQFFELLDELLNNGHRVLVFSQFTSMLSLIRERLGEDKREFHYLDGRTPSKERLEMVESFNAGENNLFLISLRAGGTGLNLTGADTVILYDLWWNPAVEQQAIDRAHRMGQTKTVQVHKLIAKGTIEEKIYDLQQKKKSLFDQVIHSSEQMLTSLSEADIREILDLV